MKKIDLLLMGLLLLVSCQGKYHYLGGGWNSGLDERYYHDERCDKYNYDNYANDLCRDEKSQDEDYEQSCDQTSNEFHGCPMLKSAASISFCLV